MISAPCGHPGQVCLIMKRSKRGHMMTAIAVTPGKPSSINVSVEVTQAMEVGASSLVSHDSSYGIVNSIVLVRKDDDKDDEQQSV
jgi:hypothetical protein